MELFKAIRTRRSIRSFRPDPVEDKKLEKVLQSGIDAPSAGNLQGRDFYVFRRGENREKLAEIAFGQGFVAEAPVVIVVCANESRSSARYKSRGKSLYSIQDASIAIENMLLAAHALGLGTCWVGAFDEDKLSKEFSLPSGVRPIAIIPLGYPAQKPTKPARLLTKDVVHYD